MAHVVGVTVGGTNLSYQVTDEVLVPATEHLQYATEFNWPPSFNYATQKTNISNVVVKQGSTTLVRGLDYEYAESHSASQVGLVWFFEWGDAVDTYYAEPITISYSAKLSATTHHDVLIPLGIGGVLGGSSAGDLVVAVFVNTGNVSASPFSYGGSFTTLFSDATGSDCRMSAWYRTALEGEGNTTFTVTTGALTESAWICYRIREWENAPTSILCAATASGTGSSPDAPNITLSGTGAAPLCIGVFGWAGGAGVTDYPALSTAADFENAFEAGGCGVAAAAWNAGPVTTINPDAGQLSQAAAWLAQTIIVGSAVGGGDGGGGGGDGGDLLDPVYVASDIALIDGFEQDIGLWHGVDALGYLEKTLASKYRRSGVRGLKMGGVNWVVYRDIPHHKMSLHVTLGAALKRLTDPTYNGGTELMGLYCVDGTTAARVNFVWPGGGSPWYLQVTAGAVTGSVATSYAANRWTYYELRVDISVSGEVELRVDGTSVLKLSGDTWDRGTLPWPSGDTPQQLDSPKYVKFGPLWQDTLLDDVYVLNAGTRQFLGPISVLGALPRTTRQDSGWSASQAQDDTTARTILDPSHLGVQEAYVDDDFTYIATTTESALATYTFWDPRHQPVAPIQGVQLSLCGTKSEACLCVLRTAADLSSGSLIGAPHYATYKSWRTTTDLWTSGPEGLPWTWEQVSTEPYGVQLVTLEV